MYALAEVEEVNESIKLPSNRVLTNTILKFIDDHFYLYQEGIRYLRVGEVNKAIRFLEKPTTSEKKYLSDDFYASAHYFLSVAYGIRAEEDNKFQEKAEMNMRKAFELDPELSDKLLKYKQN